MCVALFRISENFAWGWERDNRALHHPPYLIQLKMKLSHLPWERNSTEDPRHLETQSPKESI